MLFFSHDAAGARKSTVMQKVKDVIGVSGKKMIVVCPISVAATLIDGGQFLSHFQGQNQRCYSRDD